MKFIHISDLHFNRDAINNVSIVALLDFIAHTYQGHNLIVTGDIADDGAEEEFDHAYQALAPFMGKIFICPGNHDFGAAGDFYSKRRAQRFDRMLSLPFQQGGTFAGDNAPVINFLRDEADTVMLIALDTNLETKKIWDFACGQVGARQLSLLQTYLADPTYQDHTKILFFHHHPFVYTDPILKLLDSDELMEVIDSKVDVLCFGHKHFSNSWNDYRGIKWVLASDNSPGKRYAREIDITRGAVIVNPIRII